MAGPPRPLEGKGGGGLLTATVEPSGALAPARPAPHPRKPQPHQPVPHRRQRQRQQHGRRRGCRHYWDFHAASLLLSRRNTFVLSVWSTLVHVRHTNFHWPDETTSGAAHPRRKAASHEERRPDVV